jgi:hypothetical protein
MMRRLAAAMAMAVAVVLAGASQPARAAVPDLSGFALYDGAAVVVAKTQPTGTTVSLLGAPNQYRIRFPGLAAKGGVAHVTAVRVAHWCQLIGYQPDGADEQVDIACYRAGGQPDPTAFTVQFSASSGPVAGTDRYGYLDVDAGGVPLVDYNSVGAPDSVVHNFTGVYRVQLSGLTTPGPQAGSMQVTAVQPTAPVTCHPSDWTSVPTIGQVLTVRCFDAAGSPRDSGWTLTYHYKRALDGLVGPLLFPFGYAWASPLGTGLTNYNAIGGLNPVTLVSTGVYEVVLPNLATGPAPPRDGVQVTVYSPDVYFCDLSSVWTVAGADIDVAYVTCHSYLGGLANADFFLSYEATP